MLKRALPEEELRTLLDRTKASLESIEGELLTVEGTPDRLDLLVEGGLGLALQGALGEASGTPEAPRGSGGAAPSEASVDPSVATLRPLLGALVVRSPGEGGIDAGLLDEAVRFQELLHATVGMDRRLASFGLYPIARATPPYRYQLEPIESVRLRPLDGDTELPARRFLDEHPLARRYGALGIDGERLLTLRDGEGRLMSLPPILNARPAGEVTVGDRALLVESTGTRAARVEDGLALLSLVFLARGWSAEPVTVRYPDRVDDCRRLLETHRMHLGEATLRAITGHEAADPAQVIAELGRARLSARWDVMGWSVDVPPYRPDLLAEVDLAEEVLLTRGLRLEDGRLPPSRTRGRELSDRRLHRRLTELLLGAGFSELVGTVLVPGELTRRVGRAGTIRITNAVSEQFDHLRDALQLSLLASLARNRRAGYPQRLFELGPVVVRDPSEETGARSTVHAGLLLAEERAGFADVASLADYLVGAFGARGVREPAELPGTIPGRAAILRIAGEAVAEMGEIDPRILDETRVPLPVAWLELDVGRLWPLVARSATP